MTAELSARVRLPHVLADCAPTTPVLLGFSGGADSTALLHILAAASREHGFPLTLCHLNHGIRGEEAARDRAFCERTAAAYGLELLVGKSDVPARVARTGESMEEAAREERYAFFARLMKERGIPLLATAHHADDNLETVLFRLARGTGTAGLCGIAPVRPLAGGMLTRPLLELSRAEIEDYCRVEGLSFVTDSTNEDIRYARNRLRHEVVPILEALYPGVARRASRAAGLLREDEDYLASLARELLLRCEHGERIDVDCLADAPAPLGRRALSLWAECRCGALQAVHREGLWRLVHDPTPQMEVLLPGGKLCRRDGSFLFFAPERPATPGTILRQPLVLGTARLGDTAYSACAERTDGTKKIHNLSIESCIILKDGFDIIEKGLFWRMREDGDVLYLRGMHRKLRRLQAEAGIPPSKRGETPLLCDGEGVLWAPGIGVRDGAAGTSGLLIRLFGTN